MNGFESLDYFGKALSLAANLFVLAVCLRGYKRTGVQPLLIIGISACLAMCALIIDLLILRNAQDQATFSIFWILLMVFWIVDVLLYTLGIYLLVTRFVIPGVRRKE